MTLDAIGIDRIAQEIAAGDRPAAERALAEHFGPILRLYGRRHLRDAVRAEDLAQDTLAAVIVALRAGRLDQEDKLGAFVFGVAKNKVKEAHRAREREARPAPMERDEDVVEPVLVGFRMHLFGCLSQLTERAREILARTYFAEDTAPEIAEAMAITDNHVRVIRHRALAEIRRCLEGGAP